MSTLPSFPIFPSIHPSACPFLKRASYFLPSYLPILPYPAFPSLPFLCTRAVAPRTLKPLLMILARSGARAAAKKPFRDPRPRGSRRRAPRLPRPLRDPITAPADTPLLLEQTTFPFPVDATREAPTCCPRSVKSSLPPPRGTARSAEDTPAPPLQLPLKAADVLPCALYAPAPVTP